MMLPMIQERIVVGAICFIFSFGETEASDLLGETSALLDLSFGEHQHL